MSKVFIEKIIVEEGVAKVMLSNGYELSGIVSADISSAVKSCGGVLSTVDLKAYVRRDKKCLKPLAAQEGAWKTYDEMNRHLAFDAACKLEEDGAVTQLQKALNAMRPAVKKLVDDAISQITIGLDGTVNKKRGRRL